MRPALLLACAAFIVCPAPLFAATIKAESRITAVTVYADRATVTRQADITLPAGSSSVSFENLPVSLFPDSLRAQGTGQTAVTLGAVESKLVTAAELAAPRERELTKRLEELQDKRALITAEQQAIETRRNFFASIGQASIQKTNENFAHIDLKPEQWSAAGLALYNGTGEALKAAALQTVALRQLDEQIEAAKTELEQLQTGQRNSLRVTVPLEASAPTQLTLKLSYQLPSATWRPIYDARLDTAASKVTLTQFGEVRQATGEDWTDVALTLSTAQPARGATPPAVQTAWVSLFDPRAVQQEPLSRARMMSVPMKAKSVENDMAMEADVFAGAPAPAAAPVEATFQSATIETGGYVSEYKIGGTAAVTADNTARKVMITGLETSSTLLAQIRPAVSANAFLMARTKLGGEAPLLPGSASLFRDGVFIGSAELPLLRPGEETSLSFGIDDQVVVKRQVLADKRGSSGVIAKDNTLERKVSTQIQNLHRFPVKAEVLESLPVARDEKIKVEILGDATTAGYTPDTDTITGLAKWTFDLAAGAKNTVNLGWRLSWPAEMQITGVP